MLSLLRGKWTRELLPLTEEYGPVVRIAPNELLFTHPDAWKDIYSSHNGAVVKGQEFEKSLFFYRTSGATPSILGETRDNHALLRRQFSHGFSEKSLREQEPTIEGYIDLLIKRLRERCVPAQGAGSDKERLLRSKTAFDMRHWYNFSTFDLIGDLAFGEPFGCLEKGEPNERITTLEKGLSVRPIELAFKILGLQHVFSLLVRRRSVFRRQIMRQSAETLRRRMALNVDRPDLIEGLLRKQEDWVSQLWHFSRRKPTYSADPFRTSPSRYCEQMLPYCSSPARRRPPRSFQVLRTCFSKTPSA